MYGKNTLDKIYLTQKKVVHLLSLFAEGENSHPSPILLPPKGETLHPFKGKLLYPLKLKGELQFAPTDPCSLTPALCSLLPAPRSLLTAHCSLTPVHCSLLPAPCSLFTVH